MVTISKSNLKVNPIFSTAQGANQCDPLSWIFYCTYIDIPNTADGKKLKLRSTLLRTCLVFVDLVNGNAENLWHILELNDPETCTIFLPEMESAPTIMKLTFRIPVGQCVDIKEYHRLLPFFMAPCWIPSLRLLAVRAVNDDLISKIFIAHLAVKTDEDDEECADREAADNADKDEDIKMSLLPENCDTANKSSESSECKRSDNLECDFYVCSYDSVKKSREFFDSVQFKFISEHTYSAEMTAEQIKWMYVIDIFADSYTEVRNHLVYSSISRPKWSVTKNLLSLSADLVRRLSRFAKKHTTAKSICLWATEYTDVTTQDGGKNQNDEGQRQGKSNHTETSDDNCTTDFWHLRGGGP